jgi:hypothetical protein
VSVVKEWKCKLTWIFKMQRAATVTEYVQYVPKIPTCSIARAARHQTFESIDFRGGLWQ